MLLGLELLLVMLCVAHHLVVDLLLRGDSFKLYTAKQLRPSLISPNKTAET